MRREEINASKQAAFRIVWNARETFLTDTFEAMFLTHVLESIMQPEPWS